MFNFNIFLYYLLGKLIWFRIYKRDKITFNAFSLNNSIEIDLKNK